MLNDAQRVRASRTIYDNARRQADMVEDLLDVARIASGKMRLDRTLVDLRDVVRNAQEVVQSGADCAIDHDAIPIARGCCGSSVFANAGGEWRKAGLYMDSGCRLFPACRSQPVGRGGAQRDACSDWFI